jgi:LysR family transcriptional regulator for metE and metH
MQVKDVILAASMQAVYGQPLGPLGPAARHATSQLEPHRLVDLETRQLRMLVAIADEGTVTRAAATLNVSQPALSHGLRALEKSVGVALFARRPRGLVPTEAGERLLRTARAVLREIERARTEIAGGAIGRGELLRLSTECYTAYHWLPPVFQAFRERCPGVELRVIPSAIGHPLRALREETLDVAIGVRREPYAGFVYHELFEDELVVVMHPDHPLASEPFATAQHFAGEHLLLFTEDPFDTTLMRVVLAPAGVMPREISYVPAPDALLELVRTGLGISVFAKWAVARHLRDGELVAIPLTKTGRRREWYAAVRRAIANRSAIGALVSLLRDHAPAFQTAPAPSRRMPGRSATGGARSRLSAVK